MSSSTLRGVPALHRPVSFDSCRLALSCLDCRRSRTKIHADSPKNSNKPAEVMLNQRSYDYMLDHTFEDKVLQELRLQTFAHYPNAKQMQVAPEQGRFLSWLVASVGAVKALELGVFTGYSALCIAKALPSGGLLVACESDERPLSLARQHFANAGLIEKVDLRIDKAMTTLGKLVENGQQGTFDFAFVDADKRGYKEYHEALLKLVRKGGIIVYDNLLWYNSVADPEDQRKTTVALRSFNKLLLADTRIDFSLVPVGDGMGLCRIL